MKAKEIEKEKEKQAQIFQSQEAMIPNMSKQEDQMQTLQIAFFAATAATNTSYDGITRKICQQVM